MNPRNLTGDLRVADGSQQPRATVPLEDLQTILDALPDPVFVLSESGRYLHVFGGSDTRYYHDGSRLVGKRLYEVLDAGQAEWFLKQIRKALAEPGFHTVEYWLGAEDVRGLDPELGPAQRCFFQGRIRALDRRIEGERAVVWVATNVTDRHVLEQRLRHMSEYDELTGVPNRRRLLTELTNEFERFQRYRTPFALLALDIDHFKRINDNFGHDAGDRVLQVFAKVCQSQLRKCDLLARYGGEEFMVLLRNTTDAEPTAQRIRRAVEAYDAWLGDAPLRVTVSIGVARPRADDVSVRQIIVRADKAMYQAKKDGRDCVRFG
ncbi:MAG TPA: sensor domain-containing diguanylate cyclase [Chromatiales bacterium]|nr:sensor domain-containing diguanylate cyclase [Chromatiales bacterium]